MERMSIRAYARHRAARGLAGGTATSVRKAVRSGRIAEAVGADGRIDAVLADRLWDERTRHAMRPGLAGRAGEAYEEYAAARARLYLARAEIARIRVGLLRGEYVHQDDVDARLERALAAVAAALKNVPARFAHALAREAGISVARAQRIWADAVEAARADLRAALED